MRYEDILDHLKSQADPEVVEGMARFGINPERTYGISIPVLRRMAKDIGKNHDLALQLWESGIHEARILATLIDKPQQVSEEQMESWAGDFDSWDVCDQCCSNLFARTTYSYTKAVDWSARPEEFVKRAGFALMAALAVHDKKADDELFMAFLPIIKREACDPRNYVKKAVNWALRQIGKRSKALNTAAIRTAREIQQIDSKAARWVATDALRELQNEKVQQRLRK